MAERDRVVHAALIGAVATIAGSLIAAWATLAAVRNNALPDGLQPQPSVTVTVTPVPTLVPTPVYVTDSGGSPATPTPSGDATTAVDLTAVRNTTSSTKPLVMSIGYLDFDSKSPTWGYNRTITDGQDFQFDGDFWPLVEYAYVPKAPSRADCANSTTYAAGRIYANTSEFPVRFCAKTNDHRYAYVEVLRRDTTSKIHTLTLAITVWEAQFS